MEKKKNLKFLIPILLAYLAVNFLFNFNIWRDVVSSGPPNALTIQGESPIYEYVAERVRLNILAGKNPFSETKDIMYPFGWNFALDDVAPINGFYFLFLRPWLNPHQSLMLIVLLGIFTSNLTMYILIRKLGRDRFNSFLFGLVYGFTPFISYRIGGHPTYTAIYLFPLFGILIHKFLQNNQNKKRYLYSLIAGLLIALSTLTNLYFSVMIFILSGILLILCLIKDRVKSAEILKNNLSFILVAIISSIVFLSPWIFEAQKLLFLSSYTRPLRLVDYLPFSADLFNAVLPSRFNPIYKPFLEDLSLKLSYTANVFEDFIYPGAIIIIGYILLIRGYRKLAKNVYIYFWSSLFFLILSLGPYLKILGKVTHILLPYALIQFVPSMFAIFLNEPLIKKLDSTNIIFNLGGEALPASLNNQFFSIFSNISLVNVYGPTEATIDVSSYICKPMATSSYIPIGKPIWNSQ